ncbi:Sulfotransferase domain-containing protein [Candidatus Electrothrix laxa]
MLKKILSLLSGNPRKKYVTVVSGLPRSGTSMMMNMLEKGGIIPLTDLQRTADDDNPKGYYEYERAKKLPDGDHEWLQGAQGKAVKVISALLPHLPPAYQFRILFMERAVEEVLASQKKMLLRRGEDPHKVSDEELSAMYSKHLRHIESWIQEHHNHVSCLKVNYNQLLSNPKSIVQEIDSYLGGGLDVAAMSAVIDPKLYRNRKTA